MDIKFEDTYFILNDITSAGYLLKKPMLMSRAFEIRKKFTFKKSVYVTLFNSFKEFSAYTGAVLPKWVVGAYYGNQIMILKEESWNFNQEGDFTSVFLHEFIHIMISEITNKKCPLWLNEGMAEYFSSKRSLTFIPDLTDIPEDIYQMNYNSSSFYLMCRNVVEKLIFTFGEQRLVEQLYSTTDFINSKIFGRDNVNCIMKKIYIQEGGQ